LQLENETKWRLLDEPFDYSKVSEGLVNLPKAADARALDNALPNPDNEALSFEYALPRDADARFEILNGRGRTVDVLFDSRAMKGYHMAVWNIGRHAPGDYAFRFRTGDFTKTLRLALAK